MKTQQEILELISYNFNRLLKKRGLTLSYLFDNLENVSKNTLSYIRNGKQNCSVFTLYRIAKIMKVDITEFFKEIEK